MEIDDMVVMDIPVVMDLLVAMDVGKFLPG
jgi:hypothetical protein